MKAKQKICYCGSCRKYLFGGQWVFSRRLPVDIFEAVIEKRIKVTATLCRHCKIMQHSIAFQ